ncbi:40S ribosomal protein S6 [Entamoeba marina]
MSDKIDNRKCYEVLDVLTSIPNVANSIVESLAINGSYHFKPRYPDINIFEIDNDFFTLLHRNELFANRVALIETLLQKDISFIDLCNEINVANPSTGRIKKFDFEDEKDVRAFIDKRVGQEVDASSLGEQFKGYILKITGGCDKDGFPMMLGVATNNRVRLLLDGSMGCYRPLRNGERRRKTVRGAVVAGDIAVLNTIIVKKGEGEIEGLTTDPLPMRKGPKRASKIRKLFNLSAKDDVKKFVIRREVERKNPKEDLSLQEDFNTKHKNFKPRKITRSLLMKEAKRYAAIVKRYRILKAHGMKVVTIADTDAVFKQGKANKKTTKKVTTKKSKK